ncbi:hypothetical protein PC128_g6713 [Phytophthora cactorum]|nr:hypothetical protein PC128_g6713 [Phytophthora cactorum]
MPYDIQATRVRTLLRAVQLHLELHLYRDCITEFAVFALSVQSVFAQKSTQVHLLPKAAFSKALHV